MCAQVFDHNNPEHLESVLRASIAEGQPRSGRAWKKIVVLVEGIYSMEGEMCRLKDIVEVKKKYKVRQRGGWVGGCFLAVHNLVGVLRGGMSGRGAHAEVAGVRLGWS